MAWLIFASQKFVLVNLMQWCFFLFLQNDDVADSDDEMDGARENKHDYYGIDYNRFAELCSDV